MKKFDIWGNEYYPFICLEEYDEGYSVSDDLYNRYKNAVETLEEVFEELKNIKRKNK